MDEFIASEKEILLRNEIDKRQEVLDKGWKKPRQKYINGHPVSEEEYAEYLEEERLERAKEDAQLAFYRRCTSTGEEWEVDSDGIEYIPF
jgi:hypothetical protein